MKKEIVYTMNYETKEDIEDAKDLKSELQDNYGEVTIYPNGLYEVRIVATHPLLNNRLERELIDYGRACQNASNTDVQGMAEALARKILNN